MKKSLVRISVLLTLLVIFVMCFASCGETEAPPSDGSGTESSVPNSNGGSGDNTGDSGNTDSSTPDGDNGDSGEKYTVKFDVTSAQNKGDANLPDLQVAPNGKITKPSFEPYRKGTEFLGWCVGGDKNNVWDFDNDVVTGNITLVAVFGRPSTGGPTDNCEHIFEVTEYVAPTCQANGRRVEKCTECGKVERYNKDTDPTLARLEHLELEEVVDATCALDGYRTVYCPNGCGESLTIKIPATGDHEYDPLGWKAVLKPTLYVYGRMENSCVKCGGATQTRNVQYNASEEQLYDEKVDVSFLYTGGKYTNEKFVNVATLGKVMVSSFFDGTKGPYAIDGNTKTFWNADTYVEGAKYSDDWLELELATEYDVGAIKLVLPNYSSWELGEECYVTFDLEYWDANAQEWVFICEVSDKTATAAGISCEFVKVLPTPVNTGKIRARVTHATRYAPAVIYEIEAYAKTAETERVPASAVTSATVSVSGKYNEWATGADALKDGTTATYWYTDRRYNATPWALYEFPTDKYIACVQMSVAADRGRTIKLEIYKNGQWETFGVYSVPGAGVTGDEVISNQDGICVFNINVEQMTSKIKFTITSDPQYWTSYIYDIIPYTIVEQPYNEMPAYGCSHNNPSKGEVVPATCGTPGYTVMNCVCGATMKTKATDALVHDWGKYVVETEATPTALGTKVATCRNEGCGATSTMNYEALYDDALIVDYLHNAPAAWAQSFDDGNYLDTYTWANEYYSKYGVRASMMMSITYSDALVDIWKEHFEKGVFDLGSHSYNHTAIYSSQAGASLLDEVIGAQHWFRHNFKGQSILAFAAPLGATSTSVAEYLVGPLAANRNGGDTGIFYNTPDQLISREVWGDLNSYISKADQTEGKYVFVNASNPSGAYVPYSGEVVEGTLLGYHAGVQYMFDETYDKAGVNLVFDPEQMMFVDKGVSAGTYVYSAEDYRYDFYTTGSYKLEGDQFVYVSDGSGEYRLVKSTYGSYEKGVEKLVAVGGFTVECLHSLGSGSIYSSYNSTISKLEHITRFGIWAPSFNELVKYLREAQNATVEVTGRTDTTITLNVTDTLDDYMFNQALTIKVDIPDNWTSVSATQGGKNIPFVSLSQYKQTKEIPNVSCAIENGYLYIDVVPDAGEVVITMGEKGDGAEYQDKVIVSFEPGDGTLNHKDYEVRVVVGNAVSEYPIPERYGFKFIGWYYDEACTELVLENDIYNENATLYARWEELPQCVDGTLNHKWGSWIPSIDGVNEVRVCSKCKAEEQRLIDKGE